MIETLNLRFNLPDKTHQAEARSEIRKLAVSAGFGGHRLGEIEIIIAEITSNLSKHTIKGGYLLVKVIQDPLPSIEIISVDNGPGMQLASDMMQDGVSTKKTLGQGLGAMQRLSNVFDIYSLPEWGTVIYTKSFLEKEFIEKKSPSFEINGIGLCKKGQLVSGDTWKSVVYNKKVKIMMADGLGHGPGAHDAATKAVAAFVKIPAKGPTDQLRSIHTALKKSRGAVITLAHIDLNNNQITYTGIGNIAMKLIYPVQTKGCYSYNGIVGHIMPSTINDHVAQWHPTKDILVMHSDGISAKWDLQKYPGIMQHHPMIFCVAIYKDFDRGYDDSTIIIGKYTK